MYVMSRTLNNNHLLIIIYKIYFVNRSHALSCLTQSLLQSISERRTNTICTRIKNSLIHNKLTDDWIRIYILLNQKATEVVEAHCVKLGYQFTSTMGKKLDSASCDFINDGIWCAKLAHHKHQSRLENAGIIMKNTPPKEHSTKWNKMS